MLQDDENVYTPEETWTRLKISQPTFYRHVKDGRLQVIRVGGALRVTESVLRDALKNGLQREKQAV